ncbi:Albumin-2, partial [Bienertia sinuspersici]
YEIYAPGGIWTSLTLGDKDHRKVKRFDEVAFDYKNRRANNVLLINGNFNPQSHPLRLLNIENPISYYTEDDNTSPLTQSVHPSNITTTTTNIIDWYARDVVNLDMYMTATFRSSHLNEAYYILQNWCTLLYYDPGGSNDYIVDGPSLISNMFKSLEYTPFGEHGIDSSIQSQADEAFIFSANLVALINYAPDTKNDKIIKGPMVVAEMFPFLKGTIFENGIDSACESKSTENEAYLFKDNLCAHINFGPSPRLIAIGQLCQFFPLLKGSVFEGLGVDAAYASHSENDVAYFFKYNNYGKIYVDANSGEEPILGVWVMGANAPVIHSFVPRKNRGVDMRGNRIALLNSDAYDNA